MYNSWQHQVKRDDFCELAWLICRHSHMLYFIDSSGYFLSCIMYPGGLVNLDLGIMDPAFTSIKGPPVIIFKAGVYLESWLLFKKIGMHHHCFVENAVRQKNLGNGSFHGFCKSLMTTKLNFSQALS